MLTIPERYRDLLGTAVAQRIAHPFPDDVDDMEGLFRGKPSDGRVIDPHPTSGGRRDRHRVDHGPQGGREILESTSVFLDRHHEQYSIAPKHIDALGVPSYALPSRPHI